MSVLMKKPQTVNKSFQLAFSRFSIYKLSGILNFIDRQSIYFRFPDIVMTWPLIVEYGWDEPSELIVWDSYGFR